MNHTRWAAELRQRYLAYVLVRTIATCDYSAQSAHAISQGRNNDYEHDFEQDR